MSTADKCDMVSPPARSDAYFELLGVGFDLAADRDEDLAYLTAFMDAYAPPLAGYAVDASVTLRVTPGELPPAQEGNDVVAVHRADAHPRWTIDAELWREASPRRVVWRSCGLDVLLDQAARRVFVHTDSAVDANLRSQALLTLCRNLALYLRRPSRGNLLHGAAVSLDGAGIVFAGRAFSGKTTLMIRAIEQLGARPVADDRVLVTDHCPPTVVSWPSCVTLCEGTILGDQRLHTAAREYESPAYPHRTITWERELRPVFREDARRQYPLQSLTRALDTRYVPAARLAAIVFPCLDRRAGEPELRELDLANAEHRRALAEELAHESFDGGEASFRPWHGLPWPDGAPPVAGLVDRLRTSGCRVVSLTLHPRHLDDLDRFLPGLVR